MANYQDSKNLVLSFQADMQNATADTVGDVLAKYMTDDYEFYGVHPFNELKGHKAVAEKLWKPLYQAWSPLQRRQDVFIAGSNDVSPDELARMDGDIAPDETGDVWVMSMGHFLGLRDKAWLGIPATGKMGFLRYAEFHCVRNNKIVRSGFFCDIIQVMTQAGIQVLPTQTGASFMYPGPRTHDGLLIDEHDKQEAVDTMDLLNRMIADLSDQNNNPDGRCPPEVLERTWHKDMIWYGPEGIGASYTIPRYQEQHQYPFRENLKDKVFNGHVSRFAEGNYACFFGWPNLSNTPTGGFMGLPGSDVNAKMRVVDVYRREGDKLAENWVLIDIPYWLLQQGLDILKRTESIVST